MVCSQELTTLWDKVIDGLVNRVAKKDLADSILRYAFFWYNFMPLARGTAVVGYITILSMFLAAGMPITTTIPKVQLIEPRDSWDASCMLVGGSYLVL